MKTKLSGNVFQNDGVALLTRFILSSNNGPEPDNGAKSIEVPLIRSVLIGPGPSRTRPDTSQLPAVRPALWTGSFAKEINRSSKVKSPWNPISLFVASMNDVVTAAAFGP